jgi:hypothetical protein
MKLHLLLGVVALVSTGCFEKPNPSSGALDAAGPSGDFRQPVASISAPAPQLGAREIATVAGFRADAERSITAANFDQHLRLLETEISREH